MKNQSGFTLVELIIVIVILGVLSAVALPRFIDFSSDAEEAALAANAAAISSAMSINYAACALGKTNQCQNVTACNETSVNNVLTQALDFDESTGRYVLGGTISDDPSFGESFTCTIALRTSPAATEDFTLIYTGS